MCTVAQDISRREGESRRVAHQRDNMPVQTEQRVRGTIFPVLSLARATSPCRDTEKGMVACHCQRDGPKSRRLWKDRRTANAPARAEDFGQASLYSLGSIRRKFEIREGVSHAGPGLLTLSVRSRDAIIMVRRHLPSADTRHLGLMHPRQQPL